MVRKSVINQIFKLSQVTRVNTMYKIVNVVHNFKLIEMSYTITPYRIGDPSPSTPRHSYNNYMTSMYTYSFIAHKALSLG